MSQQLENAQSVVVDIPSCQALLTKLMANMEKRISNVEEHVTHEKVVKRMSKKKQEASTIIESLHSKMKFLLKELNDDSVNHMVKTLQAADWQLDRHMPEHMIIPTDENNPLIQFIISGRLILSEDKIMSFDDFRAEFNHFCSENSFKRPKVNREYWQGPFKRFNIFELYDVDAVGNRIFSRHIRGAQLAPAYANRLHG